MKIFLSLIKQFLFWMFLFLISRAVFFIYYSEFLKVDEIPIGEVFQSFWYAIPLDIATACYLLVVPLLILVIQSIWSNRWLNYISLIYSIVMIVIYFTITTGELGIYEEWKTKLHYKALNYIAHPDEIYNSSETSVFITLILILVAKVSFGIWFYLKYIYTKIESGRRSIAVTGIFLFVSGSLLFIGLRGGVSEIPITQSKSYFSKHNFIKPRIH